MNKNCDKELNEAGTLNEMWAVLNKYYDLDKPLGIASGAIVKAKFRANVDTIINVLRINERGSNKVQGRKPFKW